MPDKGPAQFLEGALFDVMHALPAQTQNVGHFVEGTNGMIIRRSRLPELPWSDRRQVSLCIFHDFEIADAGPF